MSMQPEITQRDLRSRSEEIADRSHGGPHMSLEAFRADQEATIDGEVSDPYER